jgi:cell division protease FtsH
VAFHEVGHALVAAYTKHADPIHKITIVPHGQAALGYTLQLPSEEHYLMSRSMLLDKLRSQLGGRAAEESVLGDVSTGAENDLRQATTLARQMVAMFGMSEVVGLAHCAQRQNPFMAHMPDGMLQRDCSEETAREIDQEVKKLLDQAYAEAKNLLREHRHQLDLVAEELLRRETLDGKTFQRLIQQDSRHLKQESDPHARGTVQEGKAEIFNPEVKEGTARRT